jgi:hypothetical protein
MSIVLQFNVCESGSCNQLSFNELTGAYDAVNNPNGWGSPNPLTSDATAATLDVTLENGSTYTFDLFATGNFPTTDSGITFYIENTDLGYTTGTNILDQIITFVYTVVTPSGIFTQTSVQAFYCNAQCCVNSMFLDLDFDGCSDCFTNNMEQALKAFTMLEGLKAASTCGNSSQFTNILTQLNKICSTSNCAGCK